MLMTNYTTAEGKGTKRQTMIDKTLQKTYDWARETLLKTWDEQYFSCIVVVSFVSGGKLVPSTNYRVHIANGIALAVVCTDCNRQTSCESAVILSRVVASGTYCVYRWKSKDYCLGVSTEI